MRKFLLLIAFLVVFSTCSSPKYTYNFDHYSIKDQSVVKTIDSMELEGETISTSIQDRILTASTAKEGFLSKNEMQSVLTHKNIKKWNPQASNRKKRELVDIVKKINKVKQPATTGDKSKNGAAIAGAAFSLAALIGILVPAPILIIFSIIGIVLSIIGLKSERKILSIMGLVMGVGFLILAWMAFASQQLV